LLEPSVRTGETTIKNKVYKYERHSKISFGSLELFGEVEIQKFTVEVESRKMMDFFSKIDNVVLETNWKCDNFLKLNHCTTRQNGN